MSKHTTTHIQDATSEDASEQTARLLDAAETAATEAVYVTKAIVPDPAEYTAHVMRILATRRLTNIGVYARTLERKLQIFLDVPRLLLCANGTLSLQLALRAARLSGKEVLTTPFSYVASVSALLWEGCTPVFGDIDEETLNLDPRSLESAPADKAVGLLPVHIYGNACDVEALAAFAQTHGLTTIYDAAQAFGSAYKQKSLLSYGDFATASFHATKVFHTVEGGGVVCHSDETHRELTLLRAFGHVGDTHYTLGINAKITEPHAAMGLCLLDRVADNIAGRRRVSQLYDSLLPARGLRKPRLREALEYNYAYYPVIFDTEAAMRKALTALNRNDIFPRRYFFPALNTLPYLKSRQRCPVAEDLCTRILCLPLYAELAAQDVERIMHIVKQAL